MAYLPIENHGLIGNMKSIAPVGTIGFIDWFCYPYFDSPSVFASILDDEKGGSFCFQPVDNGYNACEELNSSARAKEIKLQFTK